MPLTGSGNAANPLTRLGALACAAHAIRCKNGGETCGAAFGPFRRPGSYLNLRAS
jgi:hypothetical protein